MRRRGRRPAALLTAPLAAPLAALLVVALLATASCTDDGASPAPSTTRPTAGPGTTVADAADLAAVLLRAEDLPAGFAPQADVNDTITTFCAGQDATAGLAASGRAIVGFTRTPAGASVIEIVFRFDGDGAARFVDQAEELLTSCSDVPDATGLAFTYEPAAAAVTAALEDLDAVATRYGTSIGSGTLTVDIGVGRRGDLGVLVAVLGIEEPRAELEALAAQAFRAAAERLTAGP